MSDISMQSYSLQGLTKEFPGVIAVNDANLEVRRGEIHGIIGKNGAGKSVMMSMIAGIIRPTRGKIIIGDHPIDIDSYNPGRAHELGTFLIPQEPLFAPHMSIVDNIYLGNPLNNRFGLLDMHKMEKNVSEIADRISVKISPRDQMRNLRLEDQQLLAFGKAIFVNKAQVILLDEITASLPRERKNLLLRFLREAIQQNNQISFTLITHHILEVVEFCDRVTVMRDGRVAITKNVSETNEHELAALVVGDVIPNGQVKHWNGNPNQKEMSKNEIQEVRPFLQVKNLKKANSFSDISFDLHSGQVIGLAGLDGSGKYELMEALVGIAPLDEGTVLVDGKEISINNPYDALCAGIAYLPKKREEQAIIHNRPVIENILTSIYSQISNWLGITNETKGRQIAEEGVRTLNVKTPSLRTNIDFLSGGNRQKVVLNRVNATNPKLFILNEPTRGVDLATKPEIIRIIREKFIRTSAVLFTSESEEELIDVSDIIYVFYKGKIRRVFERNHEDFQVSEVYKAVQGVGLA